MTAYRSPIATSPALPTAPGEGDRSASSPGNLVDSAGNERTEAQVLRLVTDTLRQLDGTAVIDMLIEGYGSIEGLPSDMTRCECHGLWYDECRVYS